MADGTDVRNGGAVQGYGFREHQNVVMLDDEGWLPRACSKGSTIYTSPVQGWFPVKWEPAVQLHR
jgi:hypothetical protein